MKNEMLNIQGLSRIAIMGGTFDPIHDAHLVVAEAVRTKFNIDQVLFIPTGRPPHKEANAVTDSEHRYVMTVLATLNNPYFHVSRLEIDRSGTTYTIDTIHALRKICGHKAKIYFITGADAIKEIFTWKDAEILLTNCTFIAVTRPGHGKENIMEHVSFIKNKYKNKLHFLEVPSLAISSTDIRERVKNNEPIKYLLPEPVEKYIIKYGLYKAEHISVDFMSSVYSALECALSIERYKHTIGVSEEAVKLAEFYGADQSKAFLAGLLHDIAKDLSPEEKINKCAEYGIEPDAVMKQQIDLAHSFIGAEMAKDTFHIKDELILNAIRYHTTGRKKMSLLDKVVFVADCIEPYRKEYENLTEIRKLAYEDLDKAIILSLKTTIHFNKKKNRLIHPLSVEALKSLENNNKE